MNEHEFMLQIDVIVNGSRPRPWDEESVMKGLSFRARMSRKQYNFLRDSGLPLPSVTTINARLRQFAVRQGSADTATDVLRRHLRGRPDRERLCVLMFDEMKVSFRI